jgi:hypothetical protein
MNLTAKQKRRVQKLYPQKRPLVEDYTPRGRKGFYIYAVSVAGHEDKVKIGMTSDWKVRRRSYATWNLSPIDAVLEERVFCLTEEFIDLKAVESAILQSFERPLAFGAEWFKGSVDDAARHIDRFLCAHDISYV